MIKVEIWEQGPNRLAGFRISGHAGFAAHGHDIVCAAVSALGQTTVLALNHYLAVKPLVQVGDGNLDCRLADGMDSAEEQVAQILLHTMWMGLEAIQDNYQDYIRVIKRRCSG